MSGNRRLPARGAVGPAASPVVWAIAVFTLASALCAATGRLPELVVMRVAQGIGAAMMVPVGRLAVLRSARKPDLLRAIAWLTWPGLLAPVLAPSLGGLFTTYPSWRWIFLVNVPLGVLALPFALRLVPDLRRPERPRLDWAGFGVGGAGLAAVVLERVRGCARRLERGRAHRGIHSLSVDGPSSAM